MSDTFSRMDRSTIMKKVKGKDNRSTEHALISLFRKYYITGWRRNYNVTGKPDFVFLDKKIAIFTDGCFWHGHHCRNIIPKQNSEYWNTKRNRNIKRDKYINTLFRKRGWTVVRIWECEIRKSSEKVLLKITKALKQS